MTLLTYLNLEFNVFFFIHKTGSNFILI